MAKSKDKTRKSKGKKGKKRKLTAKKADRYALYEAAVQSADVDAELVDSIFKRCVGRRARSLKEDFCGSGWLCAEWAKLRKGNTALGVDLDTKVLQWGREHHIDCLEDHAAGNAELLEDNVLHGAQHKFDIVSAFNYSYNTFKDRETLRRYFSVARSQLVNDGMFIIDAFGGFDTQAELLEERKCDGFVYVWDQARYNPIDSSFLAHIHFHFPDGSKMKKAFSYEWRLWQLVDLREIMGEAGFREVHVFWEDEDKHGEGNGKWRKRLSADADACWTCYVVGLR